VVKESLELNPLACPRPVVHAKSGVLQTPGQHHVENVLLREGPAGNSHALRSRGQHGSNRLVQSAPDHHPQPPPPRPPPPPPPARPAPAPGPAARSPAPAPAPAGGANSPPPPPARSQIPLPGGSCFPGR